MKNTTLGALLVGSALAVGCCGVPLAVGVLGDDSRPEPSITISPSEWALPTAASSPEVPIPSPSDAAPSAAPYTEEPPAGAAEATKPAPVKTTKAPASVYYKNCAAVKAAGAAPIRRGDPGYGRHLDRDGDGVGCEN